MQRRLSCSRRPTIVSNSHVGGPRKKPRCERVLALALRLVRVDLMNRPRDPVPKRTRRSEPNREETELYPGQSATQARATAWHAIQAFRPVDVEETDVAA